MISHKHKFIFIHIPKCAGSSIKDHFFGNIELDWRVPNYELLYGWCPKRKIHLQHATAKQLLETELLSEDVWKEYFKFTFVRNPWDRAYSDYLWIMKDRNIKDSFRNYIFAKGAFKEVFQNRTSKNYRGDHKMLQTEFFKQVGVYKLDYVGRFETLMEDMIVINKSLSISHHFDQHSKRNPKRSSHYSFFYGKKRREMVDTFYRKDIITLGYEFENKRKGIQRIKDLF